MKRLHLLTLLLCATTVGQGQAILARATLRGHRYYLIESTTWLKSEARAEILGGHLATVNSPEEQQFLLEAFQNFGGIHRDLWIGLRKLNNGLWVWSDGKSKVRYTNWAPGQPDNTLGKESYGEIIDPVQPYGGYWNDYPNDPDSGETPAGRAVYGVVEIPVKYSSMRTTGRKAKRSA